MHFFDDQVSVASAPGAIDRGKEEQSGGTVDWPFMLSTLYDNRKSWDFHYKNGNCVHGTGDGRSLTIFYQCSVNHKSGLQSWFTELHVFKIMIYFLNTSKYVTNYVISFEVYDDFIGQKILKL